MADDKPSVWLAYITSGRDKYDYDTDIVGVFNNEVDAYKNMYITLVDHRRLFSYVDYEEDEEGILARSEYNEKFNDPNLSVKDARIYLEDVVTEYGDSYYTDGWLYTIEKREIF